MPRWNFHNETHSFHCPKSVDMTFQTRNEKRTIFRAICDETIQDKISSDGAAIKPGYFVVQLTLRHNGYRRVSVGPPPCSNGLRKLSQPLQGCNSPRWCCRWVDHARP